jgi:hypothetical protein
VTHFPRRRLKINRDARPIRLSRLAGYLAWFSLPWLGLVIVAAGLWLSLAGCVLPPDDGTRIYGPDWPLRAEYVVRYASPEEIAAARERIPAARLPDDGTVLAYTDLSKKPCEIVLPFPGITSNRLLSDLRHHERLHCEYGEWHDRNGDVK